MAISRRNLWQALTKRSKPPETVVPALAIERPHVAAPVVDIRPNDPLVVYFQSVSGVVEIDTLHLDSPALRAMQAAGVKLAIPLVSQGELIGVLNLGQRLSEQDYSTDDHRLLNDLATQAAPALRVAQLARQQQAEAAQRERIETELRVARHIQLTLLPKEVPDLPGWKVERFYQPAREVGGDFYDFISFPDGRIGLVIADVTDKGVPAALLMATTRSMLRSNAEQLVSPGKVLARTNNQLCPDIPPKMFVTCLYAIFDPATGHMQYANAGQDLPYRRCKDGVVELRATGMPLGLLTDMEYEEMDITLEPGESILFYSDGLVEAHNARREMFGFPRLATLLAEQPRDTSLIEYVLGQLKAFVSDDWEQEDDVTLVTLQRAEEQPMRDIKLDQASNEKKGRILAEFNIASEPGNERIAMERVAHAVQELHLSQAQMERLKTAVAEATMNAMEHGNKYQPDTPVIIRVMAFERTVSVLIIDQGGDTPVPAPEQPDIEAKLAGLQSARGWGLFLIQNMVDEMNITRDGMHHTVELVLYLEGAQHANQAI